jgi:hypothetical protein
VAARRGIDLFVKRLIDGIAEIEFSAGRPRRAAPTVRSEAGAKSHPFLLFRNSDFSSKFWFQSVRFSVLLLAKAYEDPNCW